ncbi:unnamed protein product, partial [Choristocarpus tenellus]
DALDRVKPGDTISLTAGEYFENIETKTDGEIDKRITIQGSGEVILRGTTEYHRVFEIHHDYYTIEVRRKSLDT